MNSTGNPSLPTSSYTRPPNASDLIKYKKSPKKPKSFKREVKKEEANPFEDDDDDVFSHIPDEAMKIDDADDSLFSSIEMPEAASRPPPPATEGTVKAQEPVKVKVEVEDKAQEPVKVKMEDKSQDRVGASLRKINQVRKSFCFWRLIVQEL